MSLSAAEEEDPLQSECVPVRETVVIPAGKRRRIESGTTAEEAAEILFPKGSTKIDCGAGELTAPEKGERVVAERDGALIAMGSAKAEVFALEAVQVNLTGRPPIRLPKGGHIKIKSDTGFGTIGISKLHPVLSEDAYGQLLRTQQRKEIGSLTVRCRNVTFHLSEFEGGVLCHCGTFYSRSGLVTHLQPNFGLPTGALESKPAKSPEHVSFRPLFSGWGVTAAVWKPAGNNTWSGNITFKGNFVPESVRLTSGTRGLEISPNAVRAEPGATVVVTATAVRSQQPFRVVANCILLTVVAKNALTGLGIGPIHNIRLPNLRYKSMLDPNSKTHSLFVGRPSKQLKPVFKIGKQFCVYKGSPVFDELSGRSLTMSDQEWIAIKRIGHSVHKMRRSTLE